MAVEVCASMRVRQREREKVEVAICRIITGCRARLNEAEGGDIWWHILGNSVHICGVQVRTSARACMRVCTHSFMLRSKSSTKYSVKGCSSGL